VPLPESYPKQVEAMRVRLAALRPSGGDAGADAQRIAPGAGGSGPLDAPPP
jgi:hypothetical protein